MVFLLYMYAALLRDRSRNAADTTVVASKCLTYVDLSNLASKLAPAPSRLYVMFLNFVITIKCKTH